MSDDKQKDGTLVSFRDRALKARSSDLIRRGLAALTRKEREPAEIPQTNFIELAELMIQDREYFDAEQVLWEGVASMPSDWRPAIESDSFLQIAFWNNSEFEAYADYQSSLGPNLRSVLWTYPSYSKAYFLLAYLAGERKNFDEALVAVNKGIDLEPDHPKMLCEKGFILRQLNLPEDALEAYQEAAIARPLTNPSVRAEALRGQGFCLMDLHRLDEAEKVLKESLVIEPKKIAAVNALNHISTLRSAELKKNDDEDSPHFSESEITRQLKTLSQHIDEVEEQANRDPQWKAARRNDPMYQSTNYQQRKANQLAAFEAYLREGKEGLAKQLAKVRAEREQRTDTNEAS
jgi:tetratricopeptide (TPR) repeat protein